MTKVKAIDFFINACLETARKMDFQRSELEKLRKALVVTRADLAADSNLDCSSRPRKKAPDPK